MGICDICKNEGDLDFLGRCEPCFRRYVNEVKDDYFRPGVKAPGHKNVTVAHLDDIRRRRIDSDGKVYRDRGRKSITL